MTGDKFTTEAKPADLLGGKIANIYEMHDGAQCFHIVEVGDNFFQFSRDGRLFVCAFEANASLETTAEASLSGSPAEPPSKDFYLGKRIVSVLFSLISGTAGNPPRRERVYLLLENGYYLSLDSVLGYPYFECDRFDRWHSSNKFFEMLKEYWTEETVNPFGSNARREPFFGIRLVAPGDDETGSPQTG